MIQYLSKLNAVQQMYAEKTNLMVPVGVDGNAAWQLKDVVVEFDGENYNVTADGNIVLDDTIIDLLGEYENEYAAFHVMLAYDDEVGKYVMTDGPLPNTFNSEYITEDGGTFIAEYDDGSGDLVSCYGSWTYAEASDNRDDNNEEL